MRFDFIGGYHPTYPRSTVIRKGLTRLGVEAVDCRAGAGFKFWARYPMLFLDAVKRGVLRSGGTSGGRALFVPEFCAKDVPLAKLLAVLTARPVIFDPLAARYETKIVDWGWRREDTPSAWWNFQIDAAAFRLADLILADTSAHKQYYCETYGLDPARIEVLPLGYDDDIFRPGAGSDVPIPRTTPKNGFQVLFFGSFLPLHGAEIVAGAARLVESADPSIRFRFIGEGRTFAATRAAAAGAANVEFSGRVPIGELPGAVEASDICLGIFGRTEKARRVVPHKIFQAMGMGRAIVTARTPAVEEFFTDGENIVLCDEPTTESLAQIILGLSRDHGRRERIARAGQLLVRRDFTPEAIALRFVRLVAARFGPGFSPSNLLN